MPGPSSNTPSVVNTRTSFWELSAFGASACHCDRLHGAPPAKRGLLFFRSAGGRSWPFHDEHVGSAWRCKNCLKRT
jgi:hypothetical protein